MTATQLVLPSAPHHNQQLFSDHYLTHILPTRPDWTRLLPDAQTAKTRIAAIYAAYTPSDNEAQTERDLIRPILTALGHTFEVQPALVTPDGTKRPDYVLYRDEVAVAAHKNQTLTDEALRPDAFAVGDAKYWDRPLDMTLRAKTGDPFTNKNPSYQIAFYIQHSGLHWGILTNGRRWRLYHRDTAHKLDRFYEVDLPALLAAENPHDFLYFFAFFRRAAFAAQNPLGVAAIRQESADYARGIGNSLKDQVFDALRHLGQGFLDFPGNDLPTDPAALTAVYDNTLILLYRLLFIFYAEARGLLPVRANPDYRDSYSLHALTREIAADLDRHRRLLPTGNRLWHRLGELFQIINDGSPPLKVATFNGGLFDPARHSFLEAHAVGDARLQSALDALARVKGEFVDYRDLAEQHLGTIYEGLLEHHFAEIPAEDGWRIDVVNEQGERKRTGVYYTPDFIVKYIVAHTLDPLLEAAVAGKDGDARVEAVLNVNVLDPAMGSAYFLVEATEHIARFLVDRALPPADATDRESDLAYWKRRVVQNCIYGVDINPLAVDLAKLSLWLATAARNRPLSFLDHHLRTGNALVGARISDPKASGRRAKPKSAKKEQQAADAVQLSMLDDETFRRTMSTAVDSMWLIERTAGDSVAEVKEQERLYEELHDQLGRRFGSLADLMTARAFGLAIDDSVWQLLIAYALGQSPLAPPQFPSWLDAADALADRERFFHWDLEFPEIFFDRFGRPLRDAAGFDAVVSNPPYVRQEKLSPYKQFFEESYQDVYDSGADLFVYFIAQGLRLLSERGRLSYISSNSWLRARYATRLRRLLRTEVSLESVVDLGDNRVFASAPDVYPAILSVRPGAPQDGHDAQVAVFDRGEGVHDFTTRVAMKSSLLGISVQPDAGWQLSSSEARKVLSRLRSSGTTLEQVVDGRMHYGLKTGLNDAFVIDTDTRNTIVGRSPQSASVIKPLLRGEDLRPWYQDYDGLWLILLEARWTRRRYGDVLTESEAWSLLRQEFPAIADHLEPYADKARKRSDQGDFWWELRPCDYYQAFEQSKILWPDIAKIPRFSWDESGYYFGNTAYMIATSERWLLGLLSSRCTWFAISETASGLGERAGLNRYRLIDQFMRPIPVPDTSPNDQEVIASYALTLTEKARERYDLHRKARNRILSDLGAPDRRLNQKLTAWWQLDFRAFHAEVKKALKQEIPLMERDDWEDWLTTNRAEHDALTAEIVQLETDLNARVYGLFALSAADIQLIEEATKYRYGEV